jgi:hypothetical protein
MLKEAIQGGLLVDITKMNLVLGRAGEGYTPPDAQAVAHESLRRWWWLAEIVRKRHFNWRTHQWERRRNLGRRRTIPPKSLIYESAYQRGDEYIKRLPSDGIRTT